MCTYHTHFGITHIIQCIVGVYGRIDGYESQNQQYIFGIYRYSIFKQDRIIQKQMRLEYSGSFIPRWCHCKCCSLTYIPRCSTNNTHTANNKQFDEQLFARFPLPILGKRHWYVQIAQIKMHKPQHRENWVDGGWGKERHGNNVLHNK